jgi:hypothetical protein
MLAQCLPSFTLRCSKILAELQTRDTNICIIVSKLLFYNLFTSEIAELEPYTGMIDDRFAFVIAENLMGRSEHRGYVSYEDTPCLICDHFHSPPFTSTINIKQLGSPNR